MSDELNAVLADTGPILLDFDGPVTTLLPPGPNLRLADATRAPLQQAGIELSESIATTSDHLAVVRYAANQAPIVLAAVEQIALAGETEAGRNAVPTPGAAEFLTACQLAGRTVVIVSNNAAAAIQTYLEQHDLVGKVASVLGRPPGNPALMKPDPELVVRALAIVKRQPRDCVMIGDSVTDIEVSKSVGVRSIGYAKSSARGVELKRAGADAITDNMAAIAAGIQGQRSPQITAE
ncbi:HAD hydrolase-like protein [Kribbella sp. NBC_00482]|uniref:HAD family hydrolase n=1 Tax=Kribbella sp. NBC_00482 TaxID=2975968 RepID=UPI002E17F1B3